MAFIINVFVTHALGKYNQWAWRIPIIVMVRITPSLCEPRLGSTSNIWIFFNADFL
jgi:hypothetical protein